MRPFVFTSIFASGLVLALALMLIPQSVVAQQGRASGSDSAAYPATEVLNAFRDGCGEIKDQASTSANLTANGWAVVEDISASPMNEMLTMARDAAARGNDSISNSMSDTELFEKTIAGEHVYITLSEVRIEGVRVTGCRLFDPEETRPIPVETVTNWLSAKPKKTMDIGMIQTANWEPGALPSHDSFQLFFIPDDSPFKSVMKFSGVALKSDTVGVEE